MHAAVIAHKTVLLLTPVGLCSYTHTELQCHLWARCDSWWSCVWDLFVYETNRKSKSYSQYLNVYESITLYLPRILSVCVDLERYITWVHQHPQSAFEIKGHVQGTVGQGEPFLWHKRLFTLLVQSEKLNCGHSEDTHETSNRSAYHWVDLSVF